MLVPVLALAQALAGFRQAQPLELEPALLSRAHMTQEANGRD